jgi:hypothetical protein
MVIRTLTSSGPSSPVCMPRIEKTSSSEAGSMTFWVWSHGRFSLLEKRLSLRWGPIRRFPIMSWGTAAGSNTCPTATGSMISKRWRGWRARGLGSSTWPIRTIRPGRGIRPPRSRNSDAGCLLRVSSCWTKRMSSSLPPARHTRSMRTTGAWSFCGLFPKPTGWRARGSAMPSEPGK